jgi:hypothetical protein
MLFAKWQFEHTFTIIGLVYKNVDIESQPIQWSRGNFDITNKLLADKPLEAMHKVLKIGRLYTLSVKIQLDLFDKMIKSLLLSCMVV